MQRADSSSVCCLDLDKTFVGIQHVLIVIGKNMLHIQMFLILVNTAHIVTSR